MKTIADLVLELAMHPATHRSPMTAATGPDENIRDLARRRIEELRAQAPKPGEFDNCDCPSHQAGAPSFAVTVRPISKAAP